MKHLLPTMIVLSSFLVPSLAHGAGAAEFLAKPASFNAESVARNMTGGVSGGYVAEQNAAALRSFKKSLIPFIATQGMDIASSYGMRELNPMLAGQDGRFGAKAAGIKVGTTAAVVGIEYLIVKKWPGAARMFSKLNWGSSALTGAFAAHNYAIK
jgi:hypothetical protein